MESPRINPYSYAGKWYWLDETTQCHGPYPDQMSALKALMEYVRYLEHGPSMRQKFVAAFKRFIADESTGGSR